MSVAIITGSAGLVGSEAAAHFASRGLEIVGIDNGMRASFFGEDASTSWVRERLKREVRSYTHYDVDIRDHAQIFRIFEHYRTDVSLVLHTAAQPSHEWAARDPFIDLTVNTNGTSVLLEATRRLAPNAVFVFMSTNKVYGDSPNYLPLLEFDTRWEIDPQHSYFPGIPESMSIDQSTHSLFGASKVAADILVQEYGRYFGMKTACFRGGCVSGPNHAGTHLHGFLAYLMKCAVTGTPYTIFGYKRKQVRDNIHSTDLIRAFDEFLTRPGVAKVYNIGGGRFSNCSMMEAISLCEEITSKKLRWKYVDQNRQGDHIWWISDLSYFRSEYPGWNLHYGVPEILREIYEVNRERWSAECLITANTTSSAS